MVPVRPSSRSDQIKALVPWRSTHLDPHIRHPAFFLPLLEVFLDEGLDDALTVEIVLGDCAKLVIESFASFFWTHPLDCVQSFLVSVLWSRLKVMLFPYPKTI